MDMPILQPIPIKTKNKGFFGRVWTWIFQVRTWKLAENWEYDLDENTRIVIPKGFIFDGASIPRPLWFMLSPIGLLLIQGLIHDFGYRYTYLWKKQGDKYVKIYEGECRTFWDGIFYRVGREVNGMRMINGLAWFPLFSFGWLAWRGNRKRNAEEIDPNNLP